MAVSDLHHYSKESSLPMLTREDDVDAHALHRRGWTISAIARHLGHDRQTIRVYLAGGRVVGNASRPATTRSGRTWTTSAHGSRRDPHLWVVTLFDEVVDLGRPTDHVDVMAALSASTQTGRCSISPDLRSGLRRPVASAASKGAAVAAVELREHVGPSGRSLSDSCVALPRPHDDGGRSVWGLSCLGLRAWRERR
jgi:hypothetical protein